MLNGAPSPASTLISAMPAAREIVVGAEFCARRLGADVEHVDDAAPLAFLHLRPNQPRQPYGRKQFLIEIGLQDFVGEIFERAGARRAGIVDDNVDLAERLHRLVIDALHVVGDTDIALRARRSCPLRLS